MNVLLLVTAHAPAASLIDDVGREFAVVSEVGSPGDVRVEVDIVTRLPAAPPLEAKARSCITVGPAIAVRPGGGSGGRSPLRVARRLVKGGVSRGFWARARRHAEASAAAGRADVIVAMDSGAVRTGWHLARRHPDAIVTLGLGAAARELERRG